MVAEYNPLNPWSIDEPDVHLPVGSRSIAGGIDPSSFITQLENYGLSVPGADQWRTLTSQLDKPRTAPAAPGLDATPEQLENYLDAETANTGQHTTRARRTARRALNRAVLNEIRDNADNIIAGLRVNFDAAVAILIDARDRGITLDDDDRTMTRAPRDLKHVWDMLDQAGKALDMTLSARQKLSLWAGAAPNIHGQPAAIADGFTNGTYPSSSINWSVVIRKPCSTVQLPPRNPAAPAWHRWYPIADDLELRSIASLTPEDMLAAYHHDVQQLQAIAAKRAEQGETIE